MTQFYSRNDVNYSGDVYSIPFDYIDKKEVKVYIDDELWTEWHFLNKHQLTLDEVPEDIRYSNIISVRRETDIEEKVVTYDNNSLLTKENLNKSQDQLLFAVQEIYDNNVQFQSDIREEVDEKVERVSDAVEKLDMIDASVETAVQKAQEATEQAQIATEKAEETLQTYETAMNDFETNRVNNIDEINDIVATIKKDADAIINRVGLNMFDTILKDHILTYEESKGLALQGTYVYREAIAGSRYGYADFYNKCFEEYNEATETETVNGVTVKVHSNGHKFYNISDKTVIDEFFNAMGSAWFYGVDTENERIFLPRDKYFAIKGSANSVPVVGNGMALGITDGTRFANLGQQYAGGVIGLNPMILNSDSSSHVSLPTNFASSETSGGVANWDRYAVGVTTDPTKSGIIVDTSKVVQPNEDKYLYICVGNTTNYEGVTDVVNQGMEILDQVNQGIESRVSKDSLVEVPCITETYVNGTSWYRVYSDGWCEQGGRAYEEASIVTLLKPYKDANYNVVCNSLQTNSNTTNAINLTATQFEINTTSGSSSKVALWQACGYIW